MSSQRQHTVISGANRGLGLELTRQCLARGDAVWAGCRTPAAAHDLHALHDVTVLPLDVSDPESISAFGASVAAQTDRLDLLINNAGLNATAFGADPTASGVLELEPGHFMAQMQVNAVGPMLLTRVLLPLLRAPDTAAIVNVSSQLGALALGSQMRRDIGYNASKAAMNMITVALAGTLASDGVIAVCIHPGWVKTDMGGANAELTVEESARGLLTTVEALDVEDSGSFLRWDGTTHPW